MSAPPRPRETSGDIQAEPPRGSPQVPGNFRIQVLPLPWATRGWPAGAPAGPATCPLPESRPRTPRFVSPPPLLLAAHFPAGPQASSSSALWRPWAGDGGKDAGVRSPWQPARSEPGDLPHPNPCREHTRLLWAPPGFSASPQCRGPSPWDVLGTLPLHGRGTGLGSLEALGLVSLLWSGFCVHAVKAGGAGPELPRGQPRALKAVCCPLHERSVLPLLRALAVCSLRAPRALGVCCLGARTRDGTMPYHLDILHHNGWYRPVRKGGCKPSTWESLRTWLPPLELGPSPCVVDMLTPTPKLGGEHTSPGPGYVVQ